MSKANESISKDLEKKILNYSKEIVDNSDDQVKATRQNPDVVLGTLGNTGYLTMIREIVQNSFDEIGKGNSINNTVNVWVDEKTKAVCVEDFSRGIPFGSIYTIFGKLNTSSNYIKKEGIFPAGKNGMGGSMVNMLSSRFIVESYILGEGRKFEFIEGYPWDKGEEVITNPKKQQGAIISFIPSFEVLGEITSTWKDVYNLIDLILPTVRIGTKVIFDGTDINGEHHVFTLVNEYGIITHLNKIAGNTLVKPIFFHDETGRMKADVYLTYENPEVGSPTEEIISFCNTCPTSGGNHVVGFVDGVCNFFRNYMNKIYLANSKKKNLTVVNNDIKCGLKCIISAFHIDAKYTGQSKEILRAQDIEPFMKSLAYNGLENWSKTNSAEFQKLCKYFKDIAEIRCKSDESRVKLNTRYTSSVLNGGMPDKYVKPEGRKSDWQNFDFIIVEGDSALGAIKNSRNHNTQGIFPIRGKIPNAFKKSKADVLGNAEIAAIITIIGAGYGKTFNIDNCKWGKVIIGADADADGSHIRALLLRFFILYMPGLITAGRLYSAVPPLYGAKLGKNKIKYFTEMISFIRYTQSIFCKTNTLLTIDGTPMSEKEIMALLYNNIDYVDDMNRICSTFAIDPYLLEFLLANRKLPFKEYKKVIKNAYRFLEISTENNNIVIKGQYLDKYYTIIFNDKLVNACKKVLKNIDESKKNYLLNGVVTNLYGVMKTYKDSQPSNITRYKGLGEMNEYELAESTFLQDSRTLIQFTMEDVKREIEDIRYLESNSIKLLENLNVTKRDVY